MQSYFCRYVVSTKGRPTNEYYNSCAAVCWPYMCGWAFVGNQTKAKLERASIVATFNWENALSFGLITNMLLLCRRILLCFLILQSMNACFISHIKWLKWNLTIWQFYHPFLQSMIWIARCFKVSFFSLCIIKSNKSYAANTSCKLTCRGAPGKSF